MCTGSPSSEGGLTHSLLWREGGLHDLRGAGAAHAAQAAGAAPLPSNLVTYCNNSTLSKLAETRAQTAFRWAVDDLFDHSERVYFWTFTAPVVMHSWQFASAVSYLLLNIKKHVGKYRGVRVFEWHKSGHGLHAHMLVNRRLPVALVRRLARRVGLGRVNVKLCKDRGAGYYLAKYLSKDAGKMPHGGRQWARLGGCGPAVRQVRFESDTASQLRSVIYRLRNQGVKPGAAFFLAKKHVLEAEAWDRVSRLSIQSIEGGEL